jgi:hypothetical protein
MTREQIAAAILQFEKDVKAGRYGEPQTVNLRKMAKGQK